MADDKTPLAHCSKIIGDLRFMLPLLIALFGGTVYGNSPTVRGWIHGTQVVEADGKTEVVEGGMTFEQSVVKNSQEVRAELDAIKARLNALSGQRRTHDSKLQQQITKWHGDD